MNQSADEKRGLSHNDIFPHLRLLSLSHRVVDCELKSVPTLFDQIIILSPNVEVFAKYLLLFFAQSKMKVVFR